MRRHYQAFENITPVGTGVPLHTHYRRRDALRRALTPEDCEAAIAICEENAIEPTWPLVMA
jgi:hypothetical protein